MLGKWTKQPPGVSLESMQPQPSLMKSRTIPSIVPRHAPSTDLSFGPVAGVSEGCFNLKQNQRYQPAWIREGRGSDHGHL